MNAITRREFLRHAAVLGLSASAVALLDACGILPAPTPTPARIPKIGWLSPVTASTSKLNVFIQGMRELGYVEEKNYVVEARIMKPTSSEDKRTQMN